MRRGEDRERQLGHARGLLAKAEPLIVGMNQVGVTRLRLSLERSRAHEEMARGYLETDDEEWARRRFRLCLYDKNGLDKVVELRRCAFWRLLAYRQARRLDELGTSTFPEMLER